MDLAHKTEVEISWVCLFHFFKKRFTYFWLYWVFISAQGLSLVAVSRGYSLFAEHRLLIAVAFLVVEHRC